MAGEAAVNGPGAPDGAGLATDAAALEWLTWLLAPEDQPSPGAPGHDDRTWLVLPSAGRPRVLVPLGAPRVAAAVLDRDTGLPGRARRLAAATFRTGLRPPGLGRKLSVGGGGLATHLAALAGEDQVELGLTIGPPRPNRKAVVQVVRPDGTTVAWAKVSASTLTRRLVANEAEWLDRIDQDGPTEIEAPRVMARSTWKGLDLVLTRHLPEQASSGVFVPDGGLIAAIARLSDSGRGPVAGSSWWEATTARVASVSDGDARELLERARSSIAARRTGEVWAFGAWHGDLTRWNARPVAGGTQVWDWERADHDRPVGFDAAHAAFQDAQVARDLDVSASARHADGAAATVMADLDLDPAGATDLVSCYLLERWLRWVEDARVGATTAGTARHDAILRVLSERATVGATGAVDQR